MFNRVRPSRASDIPLAWERLLWSGRPSRLGRLTKPRERYYLTDFRAVVTRGRRTVAELAFHDLAWVDLRHTWADRLRDTSTLVLVPRNRGGAVTFAGVPQGPQLALIVELLATDPSTFESERSLVTAALGRHPTRLFGHGRARSVAVAAGAILAVMTGFGAVVFTGHDGPAPIEYPADDAIYPAGRKRTRPEIMAFMEREVMPFAREALGPLVGGGDQVTCGTCHGPDAAARGWRMPAVSAVPRPELRQAALERNPSSVDAQMRNAVYGYIATNHKQHDMAYMRGVVMPGMARLLGRPPYDFTRNYAYNRERFAFGCYHCHQVSSSTSPAAQ